MSKKEKIVWTILIMPFVIGLLLIACSEKAEKYSTDEYWVAQGYHHVYERSSGEIVNLIGKNEKCKIKGDTIVVFKYDEDVRIAGIVSTCIGVLPLGVLIYNKASDWELKKMKEKA